MASAVPHSHYLETRITDVGRDLSSAFSRVLQAIPGGPHRPQRLARQLGLNTVLTSRLLKAAAQRDPILVAHLMPGPEPLRRLLLAAEKKKVDRRLIQEARVAVDRFQQLIDAEAGDRSALDAIIGGWLPDAREKVELIAKQSVYRGVSQLLGSACDVAHHTFILFPNPRNAGGAGSAGGADRADQLLIANTRGLRRVRPEAIVNYDTVHTGSPLLTISGDPVGHLHGLLLEKFCSSPLPQLEVTHHGEVTQYALAGEDVGVRSAVDLVHATYLPQNKQINLAPGETPRTSVMALGIDTPSRVFVFDVLLHEDIFPGQQPSLNIYRTAGVFGSGPATRREMDRLDVLESIQSLGQGIAKFRSADTPAHQELVQFACEHRGWDTEKLRGFRCRIEYPMYSSEIVLGFDLPGR